jgi:hypothetical protein
VRACVPDLHYRMALLLRGCIDILPRAAHTCVLVSLSLAGPMRVPSFFPLQPPK